jgi:ribose transport system ATP-binding protein
MSELTILLQAQNVQITPQSAPINLTVREGEIIGLAGLEGQGQETFLEILCGLHKPATGQVIAYRAEHTTPYRVWSLHSAVRAGITYLPRNRKTQGILPSLSVFDNFAVSTLSQWSLMGIVNRQRQRQQLAAYRERLSIVYARPSARITSLSGGNQQKVLLARWMATAPRVMLLNDPTRGVDLPTRLKLYEVFQAMAAEKTALVVLSTEIEEILKLCQRVLVFRDNHIFDEMSKAHMTMSRVIAGMFGKDHEY